jgi:hypothetical protein
VNVRTTHHGIGKRAALQRIDAGQAVYKGVLEDFVQKGLAEQLLGDNRVSAKGKLALKAAQR